MPRSSSTSTTRAHTGRISSCSWAKRWSCRDRARRTRASESIAGSRTCSAGKMASGATICATRTSFRSSSGVRQPRVGTPSVEIALAAVGLLLAGIASAHGISGDDQAFLLRASGAHIGPYVYLGAKHMVTGYDHLAFLAGVIFFLYRLKDVALYVTLFAVGHSVTLLLGVLAGIHASPYVVDAIIGLSVVYKALENIGAFKRMGLNIDPRAAVLLFGLAHGFGLSTKLQELSLSRDGLTGNIIAFNIGVECGQFAALAL